MNKATKLGVSALCGSLAAISTANAGDLTVTGGVDMSWISLEDQVTGNPIGMGSNLTFKGSGELDNGWGVALTVAMLNQDAYSNTNVVVTVPALGDIRVDQGTSGTGIDRIDDVVPTVWEEAYGWGLGAGINTVAGGSAGSTIEYTPNMLPAGLAARLAWTPDAGGSNAGDKASSVTYTAAESGWDLTLTATSELHGMDGFTLHLGPASISQDANVSGYSGDREESTFAAIYAVGSFTVGYQWSEEDLGTTTGAQQYDNDGYGITFAINDDLSVGYNVYKSNQSTTTDVEAEASSLQVAYSVGGLSVRLADASVDNALYATAATNQRDATTLSVALAF